MVERLERRGMLAATIGAAIADFEIVPDEVGQESGESAIAVPLPCGTSLLVCPVAAWSGGDRAEIAPTSIDDTRDTDALVGTSPGELGGCWLPACTLPPPTLILTGAEDAGDAVDQADVEPSVVDPGSADESESGVEPVIVIDLVESLPPSEPLDIRVAFTYSDSDWAAYYYGIGADGSVANLWVVASDGEATVAAFIADHGSDPGVEVIDCGTCVGVRGFPLELAPPIPATGVFAVADMGPSPDATADDPILVVCDGDFLPRDGAESDAVDAVHREARSTAAVADVEPPVSTSGGMPVSVMAAFAANSPPGGGDTTVPFGSGRRRR